MAEVLSSFDSGFPSLGRGWLEHDLFLTKKLGHVNPSFSVRNYLSPSSDAGTPYFGGKSPF